MTYYTQTEKVDMLLIYGECRKNATNAAALYQRRFPDRQHPTRHTFSRVEAEFRREPTEVTSAFIISEDVEIDVCASVEIEPTKSTREIATELEISQSSVEKILQKHKYKSYKFQLHQHLYESDAARRLQYVNWLLAQTEMNEHFPSRILFSDECRFTNNGVFNRNNNRYWSTENRHVVRQCNFQVRFGINVWMGICGTQIVGPIFFEGHLTGGKYLDLLRGPVQDAINNFEDPGVVYLQQDGAPPHNCREVSQYLHRTFDQQWIGTNGPVLWPARSPDLTPLDFFLWGFLKNRVFQTQVETLEELRQRIVTAVRQVSPQMLQNLVLAVSNRARLCREQNGGHFEQFL